MPARKCSVFRDTKTRIRTESLRTQVSVAGKRNFQARDKRPEKAPEFKARRSGDKTYSQNPTNSGLIAGFGEIPFRTAVMKQVALRTIRDKISASKRQGLWVGGIGAKSLSMSRGGPGTAAL